MVKCSEISNKNRTDTKTTDITLIDLEITKYIIEFIFLTLKFDYQRRLSMWYLLNEFKYAALYNSAAFSFIWISFIYRNIRSKSHKTFMSKVTSHFYFEQFFYVGIIALWNRDATNIEVCVHYDVKVHLHCNNKGVQKAVYWRMKRIKINYLHYQWTGNS